MLRIALALALGFAAVTIAGTTYSVNAQDKEKKDEAKKLEGKLTCTKCALGETDKCGNALIVVVDKKDVKYYLNDKGGAEKYHGKCCKADVDAIVTGKISEKEKKKFIDEPKVEFPKK